MDATRMMKDKVIKKESKTQMQEAEDDNSLDDYDFLSSTTTDQDDRVKKKRSINTGGGAKCCQAEKCTADLSNAKQYHRRHKVCEHHAKAPVVIVAGIQQRFCQQCSRFHELTEFDEAKRSCRRRLAGHNERRRKNSTDSSRAEGSSRNGTGTQTKEIICGQVDDKGTIQFTILENATYKHFQII